jgi:hypothetical protein
MADEKDRFGETMKLVERAKEDIYFAQHDRELIEKLKAQLQKADKQESETSLPQMPWTVRASRDLPWTAARTAAGSGWIKESSKG